MWAPPHPVGLMRRTAVLSWMSTTFRLMALLMVAAGPLLQLKATPPLPCDVTLPPPEHPETL